MSDLLKQQYNQAANDYDNYRRKLIPCFDDFYGIATQLANSNKPSPRILDIGAGTGLMSSFILKKFPTCNLTLIDISDEMLAGAKSRFENHNNITYIVANYINYQFNQSFDIIISSLSIHHLNGMEKQELFNNIYKWLNPSGIFINADQVLGQTPLQEQLYTSDWKSKVENQNIGKEELATIYKRMDLDKMSTQLDQQNWLLKSGFHEVDIVYKYFNFVVFFCSKL